MADDVYERIVARIGHCQPMSAKPQDIDVLEAKEKKHYGFDSVSGKKECLCTGQM